MNELNQTELDKFDQWQKSLREDKNKHWRSLGIRIPTPLWNMLKDEARGGYRTINSEIVMRLMMSFEKQKRNIKIRAVED